MEFEGTVWRVLPLVKGTSARGEWMKQAVVFELPGEFNRKLCVGFWGDKAQEAGTLQPGESVAVSANVESREYNGRWFTEARVENHPQSGPATAAAGSGSRRAAADGRIRFRRTGLDEFVRRSRRPAVLNRNFTTKKRSGFQKIQTVFIRNRIPLHSPKISAIFVFRLSR